MSVYPHIGRGNYQWCADSFVKIALINGDCFDKRKNTFCYVDYIQIYQFTSPVQITKSNSMCNLRNSLTSPITPTQSGLKINRASS